MLIEEDIATSGTMDGFTPCSIDEEDIGQAMRLLSSNYTRPKDAVLRELASNGLDSHEETGQIRPVDIELPTERCQSVIITDYGKGLGIQAILNIFGKYLKSTKRTLAGAIGGFGIGSKAPFALADQYHVEAVKDGVRTLVLFIKQPNGAPAHKIISSTEVDEPNRVTITVPTIYGEESEWNDAAQRVFYWWDSSRIRLTGYTGTLRNWAQDVKHDLTIADTTILTQRGDPVVRCGPVAYAIPDSMNELLPAMSQTMIIEAPLSTYTPASTRESIEDSTQNRQLLTRHIQTWRSTFRENYHRGLQRKRTPFALMMHLDNTPREIHQMIGLPYITGHWIARTFEIPMNYSIPAVCYKHDVRRREAPQSTISLDSMVGIAKGICVRMSEYDARAERVIAAWRTAQHNATGHYPTVTVLDETASTFSEVFPKTGLEWRTIEQLHQQTPKKSKATRAPLTETTLERVRGHNGPGRLSTEELTVEQLRELITQEQMPVIVGTTPEYLDNAPTFSKVIALRKGSRTPERIASMLDLDEVYTPLQYRHHRRSRLVEQMTPRQRQIFANASQLNRSEDSAIYRHINFMDAVKNPVITEALDELHHIAAARLNYDLPIGLDQLMYDPLMPQPDLQQRYPLTLEVLGRSRFSTALLHLAIQGDHDNNSATERIAAA